MRLSSIKESAFIRVNILLKQLSKISSKKSAKEISTEFPTSDKQVSKETFKFDIEQELNKVRPKNLIS